MRKFLLLFILGLSAAVSLYADDEIPLEPIPGSELTGQTGTTHRAPEYVPLSACYDRLTSSVCLTFLVYWKTVEHSFTSNLVHCDFGWGGLCNGYFVSGIFIIPETGINFNWYLKTITYDN